MSVGRDKRTGKYVVRWRSDGRHRSKSFTYQRDAERWDREQKRSRELGVSFEPLRGSETLAEVVEGWWKAHVVTLEDNTRQAYRIVWARHIQPALGGVKIRSLTPGRVDAFRQYLEEAGVGEPTVAKALAIVSALADSRSCEGWSMRTQCETYESRSPAQAIWWGSCTLFGREDPGGIAGC